jgi:uncharacterized Zn-finger protein
MTAATATQEAVLVGAEDLPLYCPGPKAPLWSMHPRVYLDIVDTGSVRCPYCSTEYRLKPGTVIKHDH